MGTITPLLSSFPLVSSLLLLLTFSPISIASNPFSVPSPNPFTTKASTLRYWARKIPRSSSLTRPAFVVSKFSPLSALDSAIYSSLAAKDPVSLSTHLPAFCTAAHLLCGPVLTPSLASQASHRTDVNFSNYLADSFTNYSTITATAENFTSYGAGRGGGHDAFTNYVPHSGGFINTFGSYSRDGVGHDASFIRYSDDSNTAIDNFTSYGSGATGGNSRFTNYEHEANVPDLKFTNYAANSKGHTPTFTSYSDDNNAGEQSFAGYGKDSNGVPTTFTSYGTGSNVVGSTFTGYSESGTDAGNSFTRYSKGGNVEEVNFGNYGENGNGAADSFTLYANNSNVDEVNFGNYGKNGNGRTDIFTSYRDQANVGDTSFKGYAKGAHAGTAGFSGYGNSINSGSDSFKGYGLGGNDPNVTFKSYSGENTSFKGYAKTGINFNSYKNASIVPSSASTPGGSLPQKTHAMNEWAVEPGKFFRESSLKKGTVMPMPDIRDRMPPRSFLPRSISGHIPSSADKVRQVFMFASDSAMGKAVGSTISECQRAPSKGETKKCAMSAEDVIDFAESVLGDGAVVRSTATAGGSGQNVIVGDVRGINGGKITKSVSCHQSLYPYLVYYCHSVPKVRVYEADIMAVDSKEKINHGVAICHIDTSDWSAGHGAFVALGSRPGKIEVCHWIFQGDMTWTVQD